MKNKIDRSVKCTKLNADSISVLHNISSRIDQIISELKSLKHSIDGMIKDKPYVKSYTYNQRGHKLIIHFSDNTVKEYMNIDEGLIADILDFDPVYDVDNIIEHIEKNKRRE